MSIAADEIVETDDPETDDPKTDDPKTDDPKTDDPKTDDPEPNALQPRVTEQQWEARWKSADKQAATHRRALDRIFEEDALELVACPFCPDNLPGFVFPFQLDEPHRVAMLQAVGIGDMPEMLPDPEAELCTVCNGLGVTLTGSPLPDKRTKMCPCCNEKGWTTAQERNTWKGVRASLAAAEQAVTAYAPPSLAPSGQPQFDAWYRPIGHEFYGKSPDYMTAEEKLRDWPGVPQPQ